MPPVSAPDDKTTVSPSTAATASTVSPGGTAPATAKKLRSCVTCRSRKVKCDKLSPCSNCRRAQIPCVVPSGDKPPRWARRLERVANNAKAAQASNDPGVAQVMDRLRGLENLVKELSEQLEQAHAAAASSSAEGSPSANLHGRSSRTNDSSSPMNSPPIEKDLGRLVLGDNNQSRYLSSGFWSRVNDELNGLKMDAEDLPGGEYDSSDDDDLTSKDTPSTLELDRTPLQRNAFLFRHNLANATPDLRELHPLPSQIPFIIELFHNNINMMAQVVHIPTLNKMIRSLPKNDLSALSPANEALMFSIYYCTVTSMDDEEVRRNFGSSKSDLNMQYRLGFEKALAQADFLSVPDITIVQALCLFLFLVRRHDSPRYVWMMAGLVIRQAQALGLHRDGTHFPHLSPFEVEMRRRIWWAVVVVDLRAAEDQGMEMSIAHGSFDTNLPLNINDVDIDSDTKEAPPERKGITDMTGGLVSFAMSDIMRQMFALMTRKDGLNNLEGQNRLLNELGERLDQLYLHQEDAEQNTYYGMWVKTCRDLVVSKMTLVIYLPALFSSPSDQVSEELRTRIFICAIQVAEYNHILNAEEPYRQWRWLVQTYTHWHAIVYLLLEVGQRAWSPLLERAWVNLQSPWLIPARRDTSKNQRIWVPLRKLVIKARKRREAEIERLKHDSVAARSLEVEDQRMLQPASQGMFPGQDNTVIFRQRWRQLVNLHNESQQVQTVHGAESKVTPSYTPSAPPEALRSGGLPPFANPRGITPYDDISDCQNIEFTPSTYLVDIRPDEPISEHPQLPASSTTTYLSAPAIGQDFPGWQWLGQEGSNSIFANVGADLDVSMEFDGDVDWNSWLQSAGEMERLGET